MTQHSGVVGNERCTMFLLYSRQTQPLWIYEPQYSEGGMFCISQISFLTSPDDSFKWVNSNIQGLHLPGNPAKWSRNRNSVPAKLLITESMVQSTHICHFRSFSCIIFNSIAIIILIRYLFELQFHIISVKSTEQWKNILNQMNKSSKTVHVNMYM